MSEVIELSRGSAGVLSIGPGDGSGSMLYLTGEDGTTRKRRATFEEYEGLVSEIQNGGGARAVRSFFEGMESVSLAGVERGVLMLAAGRCTDADGYPDEEKVAAFARERGLGYTEARALVSEALEGGGDDGHEEIMAALSERGFGMDKYGAVAAELVDKGVDVSGAISVGGRVASSGSAGDGEGPREAEITHERIVAELAARNLDMTHYGDVAFELAARED